MTRFARAQGSKASNKKTVEEASTWEEMTLKKKKNEKKVKTEKLLEQDSTDSKVNFNTLESLETNTLSNCSENLLKPSKTKLKKNKDSLESKKNNFITENGIKYKVFKNGIKKPWFDLPYEENNMMTRYKNFFVKKEAAEKLDSMLQELKKEGMSEKEIKKKMFKMEEKHHNQLRVELLRQQIKERSQNSNFKLSRNIQRKFKLKMNSQDLNEIPKESNIHFLENDVMTKFEDYWVLKCNLKKLESFSYEQKRRIISNRTDRNKDVNLTEEEDLVYRRLIKKEKRKEMRLLKLHLYKLQETKFNNAPLKKSKSKRAKNCIPVDYKNMENISNFDGFHVNKEGAERLQLLKDTLVKKGCSEDEIYQTLKSERRKEERVLKRSNKVSCFQCRKSGHVFSECPESDTIDDNAQICFKCGSTEHTSKNCNSNKTTYSHAKCFVCSEVGHISRECPDNPRGLYPDGGCCNECGSVEHLKRDCPEFQSRAEDHTLKATKFKFGEEVEVENEFDMQKSPKKHKNDGPKIIKF